MKKKRKVKTSIKIQMTSREFLFIWIIIFDRNFFSHFLKFKIDFKSSQQRYIKI